MKFFIKDLTGSYDKGTTKTNDTTKTIMCTLYIVLYLRNFWLFDDVCLHLCVHSLKIEICCT